MLKRVLIAACAVVALAGCDQLQEAARSASTPQENLSSEEREQLEALTRSYLDAVAANNAEGYTTTAHEDAIAALQPGADHTYTVDLPAGGNFRIIGACDNECSDLDIELKDASGAVVASDVLPDDIPIVDVQPAANTQYTVRVILKTCSIAPCYVGARVLQAPAGATPG